MNYISLQAARRLLFLEASEAAEFIGRVSVRSWQHWEKGDRAIPHDVSLAIETLLIKRRDMLLLEFTPGDPNYEYFRTIEEWQEATGNKNVLWWRLAQSVSAELWAEQIVTESEENESL